uniref:Putative conserved plasma membrane protein n=1 Tax=Tabanus bromius TaxID=304241 RepID=A0A0K8TN03_TABBR
MQDSETGETDFVSNEIGYDEETGEPQSNGQHINFPKRKFNIPKQYLESATRRTYKQKKPLSCKETFTLTDKDKVIHLKEEIILGYNKTSHRMFLLPSLFFFNRFAVIILAVCEIAMHIWAHRKNSRNTNPDIYYRSPVHILTSQFCAICRSEFEKDHINKIQSRRHLHANLKHVTSSLT